MFISHPRERNSIRCLPLPVAVLNYSMLEIRESQGLAKDFAATERS